MARSVEQFRNAMLALMPQGAAWTKAPDSTWGKLFEAFATEFSRIDARNELLLSEMDVRGALELIPEWEDDYNLPGPCIHEVQTLSERRSALLAKYRQLGEQSRAFFVTVAADLGYEITITEYNEENPGPQTEYEGIPIDGDAWNYVWQIDAALGTLRPRTFMAEFPGRFMEFGNELLECTLRSLAHDHRVLFFSYT